MKKNLLKLIVIILYSLMLISFVLPVFSATGLDVSFNEFDEQNDKTPANVQNMISNSTGTTISILRIVGITVAVTVLLIISIRYMLASAGDRADIKKHAVAYVIGAFILFGVTGILGILVDFANVFNE